MDEQKYDFEIPEKSLKNKTAKKKKSIKQRIVTVIAAILIMVIMVPFGFFAVLKIYTNPQIFHGKITDFSLNVSGSMIPFNEDFVLKVNSDVIYANYKYLDDFYSEENERNEQTWSQKTYESFLSATHGKLVNVKFLSAITAMPTDMPSYSLSVTFEDGYKIEESGYNLYGGLSGSIREYFISSRDNL